MKPHKFFLAMAAILFCLASCGKADKPNNTDNNSGGNTNNTETPVEFGTDYTNTDELVWVDMGTDYLWASRNSGANKSTEVGDYDTFGSDILFLWMQITELQSVMMTVYLPYKEEWSALRNACSKKDANDVGCFEWRTVDGVRGIVARSSKTGNSIFFPAGGFMDGDELKDEEAFFYWTGTREYPAGHTGVVTTVTTAISYEGEGFKYDLLEQTMKVPQRFVIPKPKTE